MVAVNAKVDLGQGLAAPVDLAAAANLNVAAPIEAAASANVLSPDGTAVGAAQQTASIEQGISGTADARAPQHAEVTQSGNTGSNVGTTSAGGTGGAEVTAPGAPQAAPAPPPPAPAPPPGGPDPPPGGPAPPPGGPEPAPGATEPAPGATEPAS